ncbi:MAG: threonine ammonia-lyase, partial [Metallosphaera sp.]
MIKQIQEGISKARELILPYIHETPMDFSSTFSRMLQAEVYLKLENLQKTGSFKVRGA